MTESDIPANLHVRSKVRDLQARSKVREYVRSQISSRVHVSKKVIPKKLSAKYLALEESILQESPDFDTYLDLSYEVLGWIDLNLNIPIKDILVDISSGKWSYDASVYSSEREWYEALISKERAAPKAVKGVYVCHKCKCDEFWVWQAQRWLSRRLHD